MNRTSLGGGLMVAALLIAGCGRDHDRSPSTSSTSADTTSGSSTTTTEADVEAKAAAEAYQRATDAYNAAAAVPDPNLPDLVATHTGAMLELRQETLRGRKLQGRATRLPEPSVSRVEVLEANVAGDRAELIVCSVDDAVIFDVATGDVINDEVSTIRASAVMLRAAGTWRLAERNTNEEWKGVAGCAVD